MNTQRTLSSPTPAVDEDNVRSEWLSSILIALVGIAFIVAVRLWGPQVLVVYTGSMIPTYNPGDMVVLIPWMKPGIGDIAEFETQMAPNLDEKFMVAHRIVGEDERGYITKGDASDTPDWWRVQPDQIKGQVVWWFPRSAFTYTASALIGLGVMLLLWPRDGEWEPPTGERFHLAPPPLEDLEAPSGKPISIPVTPPRTYTTPRILTHC